MTKILLWCLVLTPAYLGMVLLIARFCSLTRNPETGDELTDVELAHNNRFRNGD